jgi:hypothetical protein
MWNYNRRRFKPTDYPPEWDDDDSDLEIPDLEDELDRYEYFNDDLPDFWDGGYSEELDRRHDK